MRSYGHFTLEERESLYLYKQEGKRNSEIARIMGKHRSSIGRELARNQNREGDYKPWGATIKYIKRRKKCRRSLVLVKNELLREEVEKRLRKYHPPEAIAARLFKEKGIKIGASTIYRAVKRGLSDGITAKTHLRRRGKKKYGNRNKFNTIQPDYTIRERSAEASDRSRIGDWEGDTVMGSKGCIFTAIDRKSRFLVASISPTRSSEDVKNAVLSALNPEIPCFSVTLDNGSEFAKHRDFASSLGTTVFFADPHSPWQRGSNENINGLLRFFFPKGTDFNKFTQLELLSVVDLINDRPRKCLNWLSPREVFLSKCCT